MTSNKRTWIIFTCPKDDDWIVAKIDSENPDIALGVADCPDERTAKAVLEGMRTRDNCYADMAKAGHRAAENPSP